MKLVFLGTGGAIPTPRPFCSCDICEKAREEGEPYKRNSSSLYIDEIESIFDCPEDIGDSLNRRKIMNVKNLFITHWHPDHTFGLRPLLEANYDFINKKPNRVINVYIPKKVYEDLKDAYPTIGYFEKIMGVCNIHLIEDKDQIEINGIKVTAVGYQGPDSNTYAYMIEEDDKKVVYAPCDTIGFNYEIDNVDLLVNECGIISDGVDDEIKFDDLMNRIEGLNIKKTLLTHIEEVDLQIHGLKFYEELKSKYENIDFDYAYDGMIVQV